MTARTRRPGLAPPPVAAPAGRGDDLRSWRFARVGQDVTIYPTARIVAPERLELGDAVIIDDFVFLAAGRRTVIGSFVHLAAFTSIAGGGECVIEDFAGLSGGVRIYTGNEDYHGGSLTNPTVPPPWRLPARSFVHIGRHVLIGANAVVLPGVTLGEGAVVGAGSVVKTSCAPWGIYAGAPARRVGERPRARILALERDLRAALYDRDGRYIPAARRARPAPCPAGAGPRTAARSRAP